MIIKDLFTEKDGVSFCPVRAGFIIGFIFILYMTVRDLATGQHFMEHSRDWLSGMADYLGLGGGSVAIKNFTEKTSDEPTEAERG